MTVVFIHGAGLAGAGAWPVQAAQAAAGWVFLPREGLADEPHRDAARIAALARDDEGMHLVAHSYGANAALLAAESMRAAVLSLTLLEPACFDLARGMPAVEAHIAAMAPVFALADDPSVSPSEFSARFAAGMGRVPPDLPADELQQAVARLRALRPPWGVELDPDAALPRRTVVVTGGSDPLYEETAECLVARGARHATLDGAAHRVQDDPRLTYLLRDLWRQ